MNKVRYDLNRVPRELLEKYIEVHTCVLKAEYCQQSSTGQAIRKAAEVPLRTRAEVDADIASVVRKYADFNGRQTFDQSIFIARAYHLPDGEIVCADRELKDLLKEETSD
jgi:hypothetical protein